MMLHAAEQEIFLNSQSRPATPTTLFNDGSVDPRLPWSSHAAEQEAFLNQQSTPATPTPISDRSVDSGLPWSPTASVEWSGTCINDSYTTWVANSENLTASPGQTMQHAMMLYMSSQNKQGLPSIQDQILSTPPVREPMKPISANINR